MWELFVRLIDAAQHGDPFAWVVLIILGVGALSGMAVVYGLIINSWK